MPCVVLKKSIRLPILLAWPLAIVFPVFAGAQPRTDPRLAPIIFVPGLLGTEFACALQPNAPINLWPGTATHLMDWTTPFASLGLVHIWRHDKLESRTTASLQCGAVAFANGRAAASEPLPTSPTWCLPELPGQPPSPHECPLKFGSTIYGTFGVQLTERVASAGNRQMFVVFPWDWRQSPASQAPRLGRLIDKLTRESGVKATIVAHSFGNILFREWLRQTESRGEKPGESVGRFVSLAGPWWGVANAWTHAAYGSLQPGWQPSVLSATIGIQTVRKVFASAPGLYWIFPNRSYDAFLHKQRGNDEHWLGAVRGNPLQAEWIPYERVGEVVHATMNVCPQPRTFPCESKRLYEEAQAAQPPAGFHHGNIRDYISIVGSGVKTIAQICQGCLTWPESHNHQEGAIGGDVFVRRTRHANGDGNVPVFSAIQGEDLRTPPGEKTAFYFSCGVTHLGLVQETQILDRLLPYITGDSELKYDTVFSRRPCVLKTEGAADTSES